MTRRWDEGMVCGRNLSYAQVQVVWTHTISFCVANRQCGVEWSRRAKCNHQLHNQPGHDQRLELLAPQVFSHCFVQRQCFGSLVIQQHANRRYAARGSRTRYIQSHAYQQRWQLHIPLGLRHNRTPGPSRTGWAGWSAGSCRPHWTRRTARATGHHRRSRSP